MKDIVERLNSLTRNGWAAYNDFNEKGQPVEAIQDAARTIYNLREANAALMTERTSLIETKREQLDALTAERDMWRAQALRGAQ